MWVYLPPCIPSNLLPDSLLFPLLPAHNWRPILNRLPKRRNNLVHHMSDILADSPTRADFDNIPGAEGVPGVVDKEGGMAVEILCESSRLAFALPFISAAPAVSFVSSRLCLSRLEAHVEVAHLDTPGI